MYKVIGILIHFFSVKMSVFIIYFFIKIDNKSRFKQ